jgi:hypothetical protein
MRCWTLDHMKRQQLLCQAIEHNLLPEFIAEWIDWLDNKLRKAELISVQYGSLSHTRYLIF